MYTFFLRFQSAIALDFSGSDAAFIRGARVDLQGKNKLAISLLSATDLRSVCTENPKGALDARATATALFDTLAGVANKVKEGAEVRRHSKERKGNCSL